MQDIYAYIDSRREVDNAIKEFSDDIKIKRRKILKEKRKAYKTEKNKAYRNNNVDPVSAAVKRQHILDVQVLSSEKY